MSFSESVTAANLAWTIAAIVSFSTLLEKTFGFELFGRRLFRLLWRITKFFFNWFLMPFRPQIEALKRLFNHSKELEAKFLQFLENENEKTEKTNLEKKEDREQLGKISAAVARIEKEVSFNGGGSIKDAVFKLEKRSEEEWRILRELRDCSRETSLRLDIADEADNRMSFKLGCEKNCVFISESFLRFFGYTQRDVIGLNWDFAVARKSKRAFQSGWKNAYERRARYHDETLIVDSDGNEHRCLIRGFPLTDSGGDLTGYYGTVEVLECEEEDEEEI